MSKDEKSNYYDAGNIQVIDVIKAKLTPEQYKGYLLGNSIKYACRLNFKGCAERDAEKMANYSKWLKDHDLIKEPRYSRHEPLKVDNLICGCSECDRDYIAEIERSKHHG